MELDELKVLYSSLEQISESLVRYDDRSALLELGALLEHYSNKIFELETENVDLK